jgi:hypothetical protein
LISPGLVQALVPVAVPFFASWILTACAEKPKETTMNITIKLVIPVFDKICFIFAFLYFLLVWIKLTCSFLNIFRYNQGTSPPFGCQEKMSPLFVLGWVKKGM